MEIGNKVKIMECHKNPELVGREAEIIKFHEGERWPVELKLVEGMEAQAVNILTGEKQTVQIYGPFYFREDELELVITTPIPDYLKEMDTPEQPA